MPLHLLGITRSRDVSAVTEEDLLGQLGVHWIPADELSGAVIDASRVPPEPLAYAAALDAIHRRICVLPIRYGARMFNEEELRNALLQKREELLKCLDRVEGASEISLRISFPQCQTPEAELPTEAFSPTAYLARRRTLYQREDRLAEQSRLTTDRYVRKLGGLYRQWRSLASSSQGIVRLAFLVERERVGLFRRRLQVLRNVKQGEQCEILGPWPPYSFV